ncbi:unnamed protein product [Rotaria sordida]|uniref:Uncharacterized protein n=1 Tax=Rotaria sordida TaxID=392033 RepID=A0A813XC50_9BILA|nr:unnamed protein product [Rotaria sordida]
MGGRSGRNRIPLDDPFLNGVPPLGPYPPGPYPPGNDPIGGLATYGPYPRPGSGPYPPGSMGNMYGPPPIRRPNNLGGRYAQGFNRAPSMVPWSYGNYYLGNTTMQTIPSMFKKVAQLGQIQALSALANPSLLGPAAMMPCMPAMPSMPCMPPMPAMPYMPMMSSSMPSSFSMSMAAPMMAAATPLPVAFNPLVQGMYPMASMCPVNWMTPSSFMSALISGPMPYRPPVFDFPNNIGMIMTIPYGTSNPLLSSPSYDSSFNYGVRPFSCYWPDSMPPATTPSYPMISYYPQPYPSVYPVPPALPYIHNTALQSSVYAGMPTTIAGYNPPLSIPRDASLMPSQGAVTNVGFTQPAVLTTNSNLTTSKLINSQSTKCSLPVYNTTDQSQLLIGRKVISSNSNLPINCDERSEITPDTLKYRYKISQTHDTTPTRLRRYVSSTSRSNYKSTTSRDRREPTLPPILNGYLISDSGWLPKIPESNAISSIVGSKKRKRKSYTIENGTSVIAPTNSHVPFISRRRSRHGSKSSASEYDCVICQQQREKQRLRGHFTESTISSLLQSSKGSRQHRLSSNESSLSSKAHSPKSYKHGDHKSYRRHRRRIKHHNKISSKKSNSPRQSPMRERQQDDTIHELEEREIENQEMEKHFIDDDDYIHDSDNEQLDHHESPINSLRSSEE